MPVVETRIYPDKYGFILKHMLPCTVNWFVVQSEVLCQLSQFDIDLVDPDDSLVVGVGVSFNDRLPVDPITEFQCFSEGNQSTICAAFLWDLDGGPLCLYQRVENYALPRARSNDFVHIQDRLPNNISK